MHITYFVPKDQIPCILVQLEEGTQFTLKKSDYEGRNFVAEPVKARGIRKPECDDDSLLHFKITNDERRRLINKYIPRDLR